MMSPKLSKDEQYALDDAWSELEVIDPLAERWRPSFTPRPDMDPKDALVMNILNDLRK